MNILALDPGTYETGWCLYGPEAIVSGVVPNGEALELVKHSTADVLAIEMVASYGMPVGREVFETVVWIGRFQQAWRDPDAVKRITRLEVKSHLCHSAKAKDANIRQALIDKFGAPGTKAAPGRLYGVKSHAWAALAVAVTAAEREPEGFALAA